ncbi:MAG: HNH endonuclease [Proteobacteria bacterium]|nr:HNH endonuclease [Pseudomonadota bacterium]
MTKAKRLTQIGLVLEYYKARPNQDIVHEKVVDWATAEWRSRTGKIFRDPDRGIRTLCEQGILVKVKTGVYRYDPDAVQTKESAIFSASQKEAIFAKDGYKCVICGQGRKEGAVLHADHIRPRDLGGKATLENGQTLCSRHNNLKKNMKQTETGKKMFIRLHELAIKEGDEGLRDFCAEVLSLYEKHGMNSHIKWKPPLT